MNDKKNGVRAFSRTKGWLLTVLCAMVAMLATPAHATIESDIFTAATTKVGVIGALAGALVAAVLAIAIVIKYAKKWGKG